MKRTTSFLILIFIFGACEDRLDVVNPNVLTQSTYWETEDDVNAAMAAAYKVFKDINNGYWGVRGVELTNGRGDDWFIRNDVKDLYQLSTFTNTPTTGTPASIFTGFYTAIFRANQIIDNTPSVDMDEDTKSQLIAEAKFIRGLNYFHVAINFGAAPIITTVPQSSEDYYVEESPEEKVWEQVENDLIDAIADLPESYSSEWVGRATKGAAIGYLGKAHLYQEEWSDAEDQFKLLSQIDGMPQAPFTYDLLDDFEHNFMAEYDNNAESLFEIQVQNVGGTQPWAGENANESQGVTTAQEFAPTEAAGWFESFPTNKMFEEFQMEMTTDGDYDPRMYASIVWDYPGAMYYNRPFSEFTLQFGFNSMIRKYQNWRQDNEGIWISEINEKALRYADILLMYAEALTMQGEADQAVPLVNRIRTRANLASLSTGMEQQAMMEEIRHQRMIEFFREGFRFYDLKRWGLLQQEIGDSDKVGKEFLTLPKHEYFPIPQNELNTNPNIDQNPDWLGS